MTQDEVFFIEPIPDADQRLILHQHMRKYGFNLSSVDTRILVWQEVKRLLLEKGATAILTRQQLNEEVLPDSTPRNVIVDTLRYKISQCHPNQSMLIIDPYLFPSSPDHDYLSFFLQIFEDSLKGSTHLMIATMANRNTSLEGQMLAQIRQLNPSILITRKYTDVFHDRFWIADESRGVFVGTSLNGMGKKYAVIDWLHEGDALEIAQRYRSLP